jgi:hypothetical protein
MKKILQTLLLLAFTTSLVVAQSADKKAAKMENAAEKSMEQTEPVNGPQMEFETKVMDYGEIAKGSDPLRKFVFTNVGMAPLIIKSAKGSCGCTVPDYPKEPIMPGSSATIDVRYDTNRIGQFTKTVTLTTNMEEEKIVLTIKGKVNNLPEEESVPAKESSIF